ncbi:MAG: hypothetical protein RIB47_14450 [Cyclobacteriaceae bacterium]
MKRFVASILSLILLSSLLAIDSVPEIISKLQAYFDAYPQARVHLIFSQEKYSSGDTAFFKVHFLTEDFKLIEEKQILSLELTDSQNRTVLMQNFRILGGVGNNQIVFPKEMPPGNYTVVAYSDYMKNFDPDLLFRHKLLVVGKNQLMESTEEAPILSVHPEGGMLVGDVVNRVVLKSSKSGKSKVLNQRGELVAETTIGESGTGSVEFTPLEGYSYFAQVEGIAEDVPLPEVTTQGCALRIMAENESSVNLQIATSPNSNLLKQELMLVATAMGRIVDSMPVEFENGDPITVGIQNLSEGLNQFVLFDKKDNVVAERIYYRKPKQLVVNVESKANEVATRGLVELEVSVTDSRGRDINGSYTISVVNNSIFPDGQRASFENQLMLFGDLPGLRDDFRRSGLAEREWMQHINELLACYSWVRIPWEEIAKSKQRERITPFKYSLGISGKALFKESRSPVPDSTLITIFLQNRMVGYEAYVGKDGDFNLPFIYDFEGSDRAFYKMEFKKRQKENEYIIEPDIAIASGFQPGDNVETDRIDPYGEYVLKKRIIDNSFSFFRAPKNNVNSSSFNPNAEFEDELGGSDISIAVDDYLVFPTMADLIHEVIRGLQTRIANGKPTVRVVFLRGSYTVIPTGDPLYIIDGVLTNNTDFFLSLNPEDILTIKIVNQEQKLNRIGNLGKFGVVMVQTKKSIERQVIENSTIFPISGLTREIKFTAPFYSGNDISRIPDLRSTIFWDGDATLIAGKSTLHKFYASDDAVPLKILIRGITSSGYPFSAEKVILVTGTNVRN